ncbi:hypothetical protein B296_00035053 [Ensete ventricosum]|uniref:ER lumen protein-retaining receptor n=1 Tax=Ensete ventricosum TaxID=4639 RepID=A0A427A6P2_ENSVE|nr:hypothetical protein B296_00035053 [Ensete ventricosum]
MRGDRRPIYAVAAWVRRQPPKVKAFLGVVAGMAALVFLRFIVHDHDNLFVAAEAVHSLGISVLIYKLTKERTCAGLSLKSQDLTALFLAVRLYCSFVMEYDIHTVLDTATLATTLWVIYMIRFKLKSSYMEDKDSFAIYYVVRYLFYDQKQTDDSFVGPRYSRTLVDGFGLCLVGGQLVLRLPSGVV